MAFFQHSVLNKHLKTLDTEVVKTSYTKFTKYFHDPEIQQNIRDSREEQFQEGFLRELFVKVLGYTLNPQPNYNLTTELKNETGAKKADGAILKDGKALAVIELKGTNTKNLDKINDQAFSYKSNHEGCIYVITSNFEKLRFFINNAVDHLEFNLFTLNVQEFELLWLCLSANSLLAGIPIKVKEQSLLADENITRQLYKDYSDFRTELWQNMAEKNPGNDSLLLFKKTQKLLDRFLFIFFAEDSGLLPPNSISRIVKRWKILQEEDAYKSLYEIFKQYFGYINSGRKGKTAQDDIFAYNGGLFFPDIVLDNIVIDDDLLHKYVMKLTTYNFQSEVDVNILGHIFENSLSEIENVTARLAGQEVEKSKTKRKKDGVFYTPKYITKYIVENTVGKLCKEKKAELIITDERFGDASKRSKKGIADLDAYRNWLLGLTICDPACGSGAFLNQALEFLINEHRYLDELTAQYHKSSLVLSDIEAQILERNLYGVDINEESVDIAKLSLWLRTARRGRKLTTLNKNLKCGNSLIDDPKVAGDKAFNWQKEFPNVFHEKEKKAFHITTATHDSRTSQRMIDHKVRLKRNNGLNPKAQPVWLEAKDELLITHIIVKIVKEDNLNILAYNICGDHMHLLLVCEDEEVSKIVGKIKAITAKEYNTEKGTTTRGHVPLSKEKKKTYNSLWTQKFSCKEIESEEQLWNTVEYIRTNREKHELPPHGGNKGACPLDIAIESFCCDYDHAFRPEYKGGFDVVIGNPPYVSHDRVDNKKYLAEKYKSHQGFADLFCYFYELGVNKLNTNGVLSFITSNSFLKAEYGSPLRKYLLQTTSITEIINVEDAQIFSDAIVNSSILSLSKTRRQNDKCLIVNKKYDVKDDFWTYIDNNKFYYYQEDFDELPWNLIRPEVLKLRNKIKGSNPTLEDLDTKIRLGLATGSNEAFIIPEELKNTLISKDSKNSELIKPILRGKDIQRFYYELPDLYLLLTKNGVDVENDYPDIYEHLNSFGENFKNRGAKGQHWTNLRACSFYDDFKKEKIVWIELTDVGRFSLCTDEIYLLNSAYFLLPPQKLKIGYLIALLNSKLIKFYLKQIANTSGVGTTRWINIYVKEFPIFIANEEYQSFCKILETNISVNLQDLNFTLKKFTTYLQSQFPLEKIPKKLQNWHQLEFAEFITELNKATKTRGHDPLTKPKQVAKLTKLEEMEWMEIFETKKAEAQLLKAEIDQTDKEIDAMVFELYGLTEEEIRIVEKS